MRHIIFDLESDGLLDKISKVHVLSATDEAGVVQRHVGHDAIVQWFNGLRPESHTLVGHNVLGFDLPALFKVLRLRWKGEVVDTLRLSCLYEPDVFGGHSLEAWGQRLGFNKMDYKGECKRLGIEDPWAQYTPLMGDYCDMDVRVTQRVYESLMATRKATSDKVNWALSERIEHDFAKWFALQGQRGVYIDQAHSRALKASIEAEMAEISVRVEPMLPPKPLNQGETADVTPPKRQLNKAGKPTAFAERWFDQVQEVGGQWQGLKFGKWVKLPFHEPMADHAPMTLADQVHIKAWLMEQGWKPTIWSYKKAPDKNGKLRIQRDANGKPIKTHPKFHDQGKLCEGLEAIHSEFPAVKDVVRWIVLRHRLGLVSSILDAIRPDGRVTADGIPHGTPTGRVAHITVCNIPKAEKAVVLGKECRAMFAAKGTNTFVGVDASGLELRMLAHYIGNPGFNETILRGKKRDDADYDGVDEIHTLLWNACNPLVPSRSIQKNVTYGWLYGAGDDKLGQTAGHPEARAADAGKRIRAAMVSSVPGLEKLMEACEFAAKRGWIKAIDGRRIAIRSKHAVLNTLLQSAGSICVKVATNYMNEQIVARGLRAWQVIHMHDEVQLECHPDDAQAAGELFVEGLKHAGKLFNLTIPLDGEVKLGRNWAETH